MRQFSAVRLLILVVVAGLVAIASPVHLEAANGPTSGAGFSGKGSLASNGVYNVNYYVVQTGDQFAQGQARVQYVNATGDKASSVVQFYTVVTQVVVSANASVAATNVLSANFLQAQGGSTTIYSNSVAVLWNKGAVQAGQAPKDSYQRLTITNNTTTTVSFRENTANSTMAGDVIFILAADTTIPVGVATKEVLMTTGMYNGEQGRPVLIEINSGTNSTLNCVSGDFRILRTEAGGP